MKRWSILLCAALGLLTAAEGAGAAQVIGSTLNGTPTASASNSTSFQTVPATGSTLALSPSAPGTIVAVRQKFGGTGANPGHVGFRLLTPAGGTNFTARLPVRIPVFVTPANFVGPAIATVLPVDADGLPRGEPIAAGEFVGRTFLGGDTVFTRDGTVTAGSVRSVTGVHDSGTQDYTNVTTPRDQLLQYIVEPDADGDGWGDETQDRCPDDPSSNCPGRVVSTPGPTIVQPGVTITLPGKTIAIACRVGTKPAGSRCVKIKCKKGRKLQGNKCVKKKARKKKRG